MAGAGKVAGLAEASQWRASDFIQCVLTDVEMPEMDGFILTKKIKSDPRFSDIPVIMHSSLSGIQNQQLGLSVGVDEYVSKFEPRSWPRYSSGSCRDHAKHGGVRP